MRGKEKKSARGGVGSARVEVAAARSEVGICGGMGKDCQHAGVFSPESAGFSGLFRRIDGMMWSVFSPMRLCAVQQDGESRHRFVQMQVSL